MSSARNAGIEVAKGKYLGFVDSDDYIAEDMYELLYKAIIKEEADLSICGIYDVYEGKDPIIKPTIKKTVTAEEALLLILQGNIISVHAVNKLYKRELFSTIRYPEEKYHEDSFTEEQVPAEADQESDGDDQETDEEIENDYEEK